MTNEARVPGPLVDSLDRIAAVERSLFRLVETNVIGKELYRSMLRRRLADEGLIPRRGRPPRSSRTRASVSVDRSPLLAEFLETLVQAVEVGCLRQGEHVLFMDEQRTLALHMPSIYPVLKVRFGTSGRQIDFVTALGDAHVTSPELVKGVQVFVCFNGRRDRRRAVLLDWPFARRVVAESKPSTPSPSTEMPE